MNYYEVVVATSSYRAAGSLTYGFVGSLKRGNLVAVPLQKKTVLGIVVAQAIKPDFTVKQIERLIHDKPLPEKLLDLVNWLKEYYPAPHGSLLQSILPRSLLTKPRPRSSTTGAKLSDLPPLTEEQKLAVEKINTSGVSSLLHGDTGTGKTRVYLELAKQSLESGRSVLILSPEIGLTPQLAQSFQQSFSYRVTTVHSMLTAAERRDIWFQLLADEQPQIIIGARSALFSPIANLGLVVMDEAHESAYKQEQAPYYQTSRLAASLARIHDAHFVMGTATPLVSDYFFLQKKGAPIARMSTPAIEGAVKPEIDVIEMRDSDKFTRSPYISDSLHQSISQALDKKEQSLIYLNRRGTARLIMCQRCGWQAHCPNCDVTMTYHGDKHIMRCHICGHTENAPSMCPSCKNPDVVYRSIGTKALVAELERLFKGARVRRFDTDSAKPERLENMYDSILAGDVDILVGTQLLGKGLDLPGLSVVGVVQADSSLALPDYTANERTFQQLTQIIGRVGRGHRKGRVIIQSFNPDNPAIRSAISQDYEGFYERELEERRLFEFPPFRYLLKLECTRASRSAAERAATTLKSKLAEMDLPVEIIGPSPAFHERISNKYRWQLIIKARQRPYLVKIIHSLPANWSYDIDPTNLL